MPGMGLRSAPSLEGRFSRLVALGLDHAESLARAADDPEVWRFLPYGPADTPETMRVLIRELLDRWTAGTDVPFTVLALPGDLPIGMTRYLEIDRTHRRLEIGGTWFDAAHRRTPVNTETKFLLLRHAFENEGANRVQFKTDLRNLRSQSAIERIGATREGVLRDHMVMPDGFLRSSVLYSITAAEWPSIRVRLEGLLSRPWNGRGAAASA
ncbi:MAG TPA: GNAT family protein [Thermoplasmata archaeon]